MNYILDTNICVEMIKTKSFSILKHAKKKTTTQIFITSVTESELWYGVHNSQKIEENKFAVENFLEFFPKLSFTSSAAEISGELRARQKSIGKSIGHNDLLIASIALDVDAILVTANEKELKQIQDLRIENWLKS
jgi:tRNA(fMet)-specific endonuclease VapC